MEKISFESTAVEKKTPHSYNSTSSLSLAKKTSGVVAVPD
jgi:hypothetical protein